MKRELTEWQKGKPPKVGWWNVRFVGVPSTYMGVVRRRYWNGFFYSWPVAPGVHNERDAECLKSHIATNGWYAFEWQGLTYNPLA